MIDIERAESFLEAGEYSRAKVAFEDLLASVDPETRDRALFGAAHSSVSLAHFTEGLAVANRLTSDANSDEARSRGMLVRAEALRGLGRYRDALLEAERGLSAVRNVADQGYGQWIVGNLLCDLGDHRKSAAEYREVLPKLDEAGPLSLRVRARISLASELRTLDDHEAMNAELASARSLAVRLPHAHPWHGLLRLNEAAAMLETERFAEREEMLRNALTMLKASLGTDHPMLIPSLCALSDSHAYRDELEVAEGYADEARRIAYASEAPDVHLPSPLAECANVRIRQGRYRDAEALLLDAVARSHRAQAEDRLALRLGGLANLYREIGRTHEAKDLFEQAIPMLDASQFRDTGRMALLLNNYGLVLFNLRRYADAEAVHRRVVEIRRRTPNGSALATAYNNVGRAVAWQGRLDEAVVLYDAAIDTLNKLGAPNLRSMAVFVGNLAEAREGQGRWSDAERLYRRTLEILDAALGADHTRHVWYLRQLARLLLNRRALDDAQKVLIRAKAICEAANERYDGILQDLAAVEDARGNRTVAAELRARAKRTIDELETKVSRPN